MSEKKAPEQRPVAASVDPRQLELMLVDGAERANGAAAAQLQGDAADRARAILSSLDRLSSEEVFAAFEELDALPRDVVRAALADSTGPLPDPELLDDAIRRAHGFPPRALRLVTTAIVKDADIFDLGSVAEEQVRLAGKSWDGRDLAAEERLDEEVEGSFAGTLEHHTLADAGSASRAPLFDVLRYADDAGAIFRAGTTELVGAIAYDTVEMKDRRDRVAIQQALAAEPEPVAAAAAEEAAAAEPEEVAAEIPEAPSAASEPTLKKAPSAPKRAQKAEAAPPKAARATPKKSAKAAPAKAAPAKKATAKKAPAKPALAKPAPAKPAPAKKATAKEAAAKAAPAKKATAKAAPDKKAPVKAATAKTTAKKSTVKKSTAKKSTTKKS